MNYEKFGIGITLAIMTGLLGFAGVANGSFGDDFAEIKIPSLSLNNTESSSSMKSEGFYEYCYKMGIKDCQ